MATKISGVTTHTYVVESVKRGLVTLRLPDGTKSSARAGDVLTVSHTFEMEKK